MATRMQELHAEHAVWNQEYNRVDPSPCDSGFQDKAAVALEPRHMLVVFWPLSETGAGNLLGFVTNLLPLY